jgi:hypothetical protein
MKKYDKLITEYTKKIFAQNLNEYRFVDGKFLSECISIFPRFKCQNCGLYGRAILCPPMVEQTYPQFATINNSKAWYANNIISAAIFVFKNDGTLRWKRGKTSLSHIEFKIRYGRQLKGVENGSAKEINRQMWKLQGIIKEVTGEKTISLICGHCDICPGAHRCPNRENPPCRRKGMTSLESTGLDVYAILKKLDIGYEYPVLSYLTQVTCFLIVKPKKEWRD